MVCDLREGYCHNDSMGLEFWTKSFGVHVSIGSKGLWHEGEEESEIVPVEEEMLVCGNQKSKILITFAWFAVCRICW